MSFKLKVNEENKSEAKKDKDPTLVRVNGIMRIVGKAKERLEKIKAEKVVS